MKVSNLRTCLLKTKKRRRLAKNDEELSWNCSRKRLESVMEAPWLGFSSRNNFFHPKQLKCIANGLRDIWNSLPSPIYRKRGEEVAAQLAQASSTRPGKLGCFLQKQPCFENILEGPRFKNFKIDICTPILISSPPFFRNFMEKLQKPCGSI